MSDNNRAKKGHMRPTYKCNRCEEMKDISECFRTPSSHRAFVVFTCRRGSCPVKSHNHFFYREIEEGEYIAVPSTVIKNFLNCIRHLNKINDERNRQRYERQ